MSKITIIRGDSRTITATFIDSDGDPIDLTGGEIFFTANSDSAPTSDSSAAISKDITSFDAPTTGVQAINLTASDTNVTPGTYFYDIQFVSSAGTVISQPKNKLIVQSDITRRVA